MYGLDRVRPSFFLDMRWSVSLLNGEQILRSLHYLSVIQPTLSTTCVAGLVPQLSLRLADTGVMRVSEKIALAGVLGTCEWCKALLAAWWWLFLWLDPEDQGKTGPSLSEASNGSVFHLCLRAE